MTQKALAEKSGISISALQRYEADERIPAIDAIYKIATALGVDVLEIIDFHSAAATATVPAAPRLTSNPPGHSASPIGSNIREYRQQKGMTQRELAAAIGKSYSSIQKYELDIATPPLSIIHKIAAALGVDAWKLIGSSDIAAVLHTTPAHLMDWDENDEMLPSVTVIDHEEVQNTLRIILTEKEFAVVRAYQSADERAQNDALLLLQTHQK